MGLAKRIGKNERIRGLLCWLAARYIRFIRWSGDWRHVGREVPERLRREGRPFIVAFWHSRLLMMGETWIGGPFHMLISQHRDGVLIARTVAHFGITTIAGSTSKGGAAAFRAILKALKAGEAVGITPDGPRGPRQRCSTGVVDLARMSGAVVVPLTYSCRGRRLRSWDRFHFPFPFARGVFLWGEPIEVPKDGDVEAIRRHIEEVMNAQMAEADRMTGMEPVEPAGERP